MAPEYFMHGVIHEKTDVFSFGVLLLELITGRRAVNSHRKSLVIWVCESRFEWSISTHLLYGLSQSCLIFDNTIQMTTCFDPLASPPILRHLSKTTEDISFQIVKKCQI